MTRVERNEAALRSNHPQFAVRMRLLLRWSEMRGMELLIVRAWASFQEQERIYLSGAQAAPPGHSYHELGLADDVVDVAAGASPHRYDPADWDRTDYEAIASYAESLGMVAGHHWQRKDSPHLEWHPGYSPREAFILNRLTGADGKLPDTFFDPPKASPGGISTRGRA